MALYYIQEGLQKEKQPFKLAIVYYASNSFKDKYPPLWELKTFL